MDLAIFNQRQSSRNDTWVLSRTTLADARDTAFQQRKLIQQGINPLAERQRRQWSGIETVEQLFDDWYKNDLQVRLQHANIPKRIYTKEIHPVMGKIRIDQVTALDVREVIKRVVDSGRKSELCEAMWREMDLTTGVWDLPKERSKIGVPISIPLPRQAITWFNELQIRACGSPYVFPARRASHRPHMGPDTLS